MTGLLLRQNKNLPINTWRVIRFDPSKGKDSKHPTVGTGYFVLFEVDNDSISALKLTGFKVSFALTSVILRKQGKASTDATQEVMEVDGTKSHAEH